MPLSSHSPEEQQHSLGKGLKVVVPVDLCGVIQGDFPKHLLRRGERFNMPSEKPGSCLLLDLRLSLQVSRVKGQLASE